jgi:hypothetical protein
VPDVPVLVVLVPNVPVLVVPVPVVEPVDAGTPRYGVCTTVVGASLGVDSDPDDSH